MTQAASPCPLKRLPANEKGGRSPHSNCRRRTGDWSAPVALLRLAAAGDNVAMQIEPPKADRPKRKRRWFQFSLRTLLIVIAIVAIPCAWLGSRIERKRKEREAVAAVEALGGYVWYDYQAAAPGGPPWASPAEPYGPAWLRSFLRDDFFSEVTGVSLQDANVSDADLVNLKGLSYLESLNLVDRISITDAGLINIRGLAQLKMLDLQRTNVSDVGVANLKGLGRLKTMYLFGTKVTAAGVNEVRKMLPNCEIITDET